MKSFFFGWQNIKKFFRELALTLTGKESRFSQKKIIVYCIDISMLITSLIYMYYKRETMSAGDHCMIVGMWLAKGASNVMMSQGDKKIVTGDDETTTEEPAPDPNTKPI